jgi:hypothetical protein
MPNANPQGRHVKDKARTSRFKATTRFPNGCVPGYPHRVNRVMDFCMVPAGLYRKRLQ